MATDFSSGTTGRHLDLPAALSKIGEEAVVRDMLGMLADLLAQDVPKIQRAMLNQDMDVAGRLLHSLKGCMPIFCTPPICEQLAVVESLTKKGDFKLAEHSYEGLAPALAALQLEIQFYLANPPAKLE